MFRTLHILILEIWNYIRVKNILQTRKVPVNRTLTFQKNCFIYFNESSLKIMKQFSFHLKSSFRSRDI